MLQVLVTKKSGKVLVTGTIIFLNVLTLHVFLSALTLKN